MAVCENGRCSLQLHSSDEDVKSLLHHSAGDDDDELKKEAVAQSIDSSASKKPSGSSGHTGMFSSTRPPSCILGIGTATPERIFPMCDFAKDFLHGFGECNTPDVREFSERICKLAPNLFNLIVLTSLSLHEHKFPRFASASDLPMVGSEPKLRGGGNFASIS